MPPIRTPSPAAQSRRDLDELISAILDKLEADDPAWAATLSQSLKDARMRAAGRAAKVPATP